MHIIYVTTAMQEEVYASLLKVSKYAPNPSNQNFHSLLIDGLSQTTPVDVISARPYSHKQQKIGYYPPMHQANFHYLGVMNAPILKPISIVKQAVKWIENIRKKDSIILVDSLNLTLFEVVKHCKNKWQIPVFALVTDLAENMSSVPNRYKQKMQKTYALYDGFLCLTEGINSKVNLLNKPFHIFHGLVKESRAQSNDKSYSPYFFFAGAIYRRYGIIALLEAFSLIQGDYQLLIAGQGPDVPYVLEACENDARIHYLGVLPRSEVLAYEAASLANINPRLFDVSLDQYSIPSKLLEYLASGRPTITTHHTLLLEEFGDYVIHAKEGDTVDLAEAMVALLKNEEHYNQLAKKAKEILFAHYDYQVVSQKIIDYLTSVTKMDSSF